MKLHSRSVAAVVLTILLSVQVAPMASAAPRDADDIRAKIERILQKLQRVVRLIPFDNSAVPPHP